MSEKTELPSKPTVRCIRLVGRCVEVGDDDEGQPRLIIHTTREQLMNFGRNLAYVDVEVTLHSPNAGQKDRYAGKLLIEATVEIHKLQTALCDLMPYVLEDYYPNCATPGYKAAVEAAKALTPNDPR